MAVADAGSAAAIARPCPRHVRVGANSPRRWPTMFSVMNTGTCRRPSWTAMVWPTMIGRIIDGRDQVFTTFFSFSEFRISIFSLRDFSTKGPFFTDLLIAQSPASPGDTPQAGGLARHGKAAPRSIHHYLDFLFGGRSVT